MYSDRRSSPALALVRPCWRGRLRLGRATPRRPWRTRRGLAVRKPACRSAARSSSRTASTSRRAPPSPATTASSCTSSTPTASGCGTTTTSRRSRLAVEAPADDRIHAHRCSCPRHPYIGDAGVEVGLYRRRPAAAARPRRPTASGRAGLPGRDAQSAAGVRQHLPHLQERLASRRVLADRSAAVLEMDAEDGDCRRSATRKTDVDAATSNTAPGRTVRASRSR